MHTGTGQSVSVNTQKWYRNSYSEVLFAARACVLVQFRHLRYAAATTRRPTTRGGGGGSRRGRSCWRWGGYMFCGWVCLVFLSTTYCVFLFAHFHAEIQPSTFHPFDVWVRSRAAQKESSPASIKTRRPSLASVSYRLSVQRWYLCSILVFKSPVPRVTRLPSVARSTV